MELGQVYQKAINSEPNSDASHPHKNPTTRITVQGGIGTSIEHQFLINYYELDGAGWGSPFLLVPDATNVDSKTLSDLTTATADDYYVSGASPLGVPFNNFRKSSAEQQRLERIAKGRPGSPCTKKYLVSNTEFTSEPICTASRKYQHRKIKQLQAASLEPHELQRQLNEVLEKPAFVKALQPVLTSKTTSRSPKKTQPLPFVPAPTSPGSTAPIP